MIHAPPHPAPPAPAATTAALRWTVSEACPADWAAVLAACGGTFFHAPPVLDLSLPPGTPLFARLTRGGHTVGAALGVRTHCRLSRRARHVRFAAPPCVAPGVDRDQAAALLAAQLGGAGAAEVRMESFGAFGEARPRGGGVPSRRRREHALELADDEGALLRHFGRTHRRRAQRGGEQGWRFETLAGGEAVRLLHAAQTRASERAAGRGDPFHAPLPPAAVGRPAAPDEPWGMRVLAGFSGGTLLGAALVGWGGEHAYYLLGGSTEEGYRAGSAQWLHLRAMRMMAARGCRVYNLGGTPVGAEAPAHPAHGLFRFKADFGAREQLCRGALWELSPAHHLLHRILHRVSR